MNRNEVVRIFEEKKDLYIDSHTSRNQPIAYILGGQPSAGKSSLNKIIEEEYQEAIDIVINGDNYRVCHPQYNELKKDPLTFSSETQIFSNVFTEGLIAEAIKRRLSVSIEGTMRRSEVIANTAKKFKSSGYKVELLCISAPSEATAINLFSRYADEVAVMGSGRLADFESHHQACIGIPKTLDDAYEDKNIDRIRLYSIFGIDLIADYKRVNGEWSINVKPSDIIVASRNAQLQNPRIVFPILDKGLAALGIIQEESIRKELLKQIQVLMKTIPSLNRGNDMASTIREDNLLDEIDRLTNSVELFKKSGIDTLWRECKEYNSSPLYKRERASTGELTISQALRMGLDKTAIKTQDVTLDTAQSEIGLHLRVNGKTIDERQKEENAKSIGMKR